MRSVIEALGFGPVFRGWINTIYAHPVASVITNQNVSSPFKICRGRRQGCPLSPFLFAILIKPRALSIRQHPEICPVNIKGIPHHLSLYADDILLYISNPQKSVPSVLALIKTFGTFSGFTINWEKSELMPVTTNIDPQFLKSIKYPLKKKSIILLYILELQLLKNPKICLGQTGNEC